MILPLLSLALAPPVTTLQTRDARIAIDARGYITSLASGGHDYSPPGHPSPLLTLNINGALTTPTRATHHGSTLTLSYPQGSIATIKAQAKERYLRFQLLSLTHREKVQDVVWGPLHTTISERIGDLIGVVRDDDFAIGMLGLDDNTIAGPPVDGECYGMHYFIHSPDPKRWPVPAKYKEGQTFNIGGDGVSDVAFYSHPEEYFQQAFGNAAWLEPSFGSSLAYHSRDRRKASTVLFSLLPGFTGSRPRHIVADPVDVDYISSAVAIYACPDRQGLSTIESIELAEGLPHPMIDGRWIHDPAALRPGMIWYGPHDKLIEYADALGLKAVQDEGQGEYYANPADHWQGNRVGFSGGRSLTYPQFTRQTNAHGVKYGLHTLCLFLQPGRCTDVTPEPNPHLQTVLRTRLAEDISPADTRIDIADPSFLAEDGTWPMRDGSNTLRIGSELIHYAPDNVWRLDGPAPFLLTSVQRGYDGTLPQAHRAGEEVVKLQMNCYNGFCPDMALMPAYADYYARVMSENGMRYVDFDGLESTLYQSQGYYGVRRFFRRFFDTYAKLTGGLAPRVMGSCVFAGGWEYMSVCDVGGGNNMFDPVLNRWGIEGKDVRNGLGNSYFPPTLGGQDYRSDWSVYDAENLQAKAIGWDATFMLGLSEEAVERSGEKDAIFKAFRTWEDAREAGVFTPRIKARLRDLSLKFHLERLGPRSFSLTPVKEIRATITDGRPITIQNPYAAQPLNMAIRFTTPTDGCTFTLPDGQEVVCNHKIEAGQFLIIKSGRAYLADKFRKPLADLFARRLWLLHGESRISWRGAPTEACDACVWGLGAAKEIGAINLTP